MRGIKEKNENGEVELESLRKCAKGGMTSKRKRGKKPSLKG